jgi:hypothetical protein
VEIVHGVSAFLDLNGELYLAPVISSHPDSNPAVDTPLDSIQDHVRNPVSRLYGNHRPDPHVVQFH